MAKPRLKVYRARMGFAETVVAAANQKAALDAWGARQNLFGEGLAAPADDPDAVAAALARPGEVLQRPVGSSDPFRPGPAAPPKLPPAPPRAAPAPGRSARAAAPKDEPPAPPPPPPPDRSALSAAERAVTALEKEAVAARAELDRRRAALEAEAKQLEQDLARRRREAECALQAARRAYARAGGALPPG